MLSVGCREQQVAEKPYGEHLYIYIISDHIISKLKGEIFIWSTGLAEFC